MNIERLIGATKTEILEELGEGFNFYPDNLWVYDFKKNWWSKSLLLLSFDNNMLIDIKIKKSFFKFL